MKTRIGGKGKGNVLQVGGMTKKEITELRARERMKGLSTFDAIHEYYHSDLPVRLNATQEEIRLRYVNTWSKLMKGMPRHKVRESIIEEHGVTERTAYSDIRNCEKIFGSLEVTDKAAKRQMVERLILEAKEIAELDENVDGMLAAADKIIKLYGLDKEDIDMPEWDKMEPSVYPIVLDEFSKGLFEKLMKSSSSVDISEMMGSLADEAIIEEE